MVEVRGVDLMAEKRGSSDPAVRRAQDKGSDPEIPPLERGSNDPAVRRAQNNRAIAPVSRMMRAKPPTVGKR